MPGFKISTMSLLLLPAGDDYSINFVIVYLVSLISHLKRSGIIIYLSLINKT